MGLKCSFCGIPESNKIKIIEGIEGNICEECFVELNGIFDSLDNEKDDISLYKPHILKEKLDKYVIGQEKAKKMLSVGVYNHYKRLNHTTNIKKSNILINGATGSGKTYLIQNLAKILNVPLNIVDSTVYTEAGYVGEDVETILEGLLKKADGDIKKAEKGIVYLDEIDKLSKGVSSGGDVGGSNPSRDGVQKALLKIVEDGEIEVPFKDNKVTMNTKNILFIAGGAFVGLDNIVKNRIKKKKSKIGFKKTHSVRTKDNRNSILTEDIVKFGIIPELAGRFPVVVSLNKLTKKELKRILIEPKDNLISQYKQLLEIDKVKLEIEDEVLDYIAEEAIEKDLGARGLKGVLEEVLYEIMYDVPQKENAKDIVITKELFLKQ